MRTIQDYLREIYERAAQQAGQAEKDYRVGERHCMQGLYDKWYRYNRDDDGEAYDLGWTTQNATTQNDTVRFINIDNQY